MGKMLVSAYGCEPNKGSEQGVGWHWVLEMAKTQELWVITRSNNRLGIEGAFPSEFAERVHFIYYDLPPVFRRFKRKEKGLYFYYVLWQWGAYQCAKKLAAEVQFDYCQHLTFGSMWMPTFMYRLPIPFIWGPIGGGESVPFGLIRSLPWQSRIAQYARYLLIRFAAINPLITFPARAAKVILARTDDSKNAFPQHYRSKVKVILETGISLAQLHEYQPEAQNVGTSTTIELIYTGRLVALKNIMMAILAFAIVSSANKHIRMMIVGDGPLKVSLTALAHQLGVSDRIKFVGAVSQQEVIQTLQQSDIFLFPSLKEGGTWSLMEAMAVGLPVICLDTTGMHIITDRTCAIRIPPADPVEMTNRMAEAITLLVNSAELRKTMGANGRRRIEEQFLWSRKGAFMVELLSELEGQSAVGEVR